MYCFKRTVNKDYVKVDEKYSNWKSKQEKRASDIIRLVGECGMLICRADIPDKNRIELHRDFCSAYDNIAGYPKPDYIFQRDWWWLTIRMRFICWRLKRALVNIKMLDEPRGKVDLVIEVDRYNEKVLPKYDYKYPEGYVDI